MSEDYYTILGVSRGASQAEIKKAYHKLARQYHPDLHPDDKDAQRKFQQVQAAYDVLKDPSKRELYDRYGSSFEEATTGGPRTQYTWRTQGGAGFEDFDFSQFFGDRFGGSPGEFADVFQQFRRASAADGGRRQRAAQRGGDLQAEVTIPFTVAVLGGATSLSIRRASGGVETISVKIPAGIDDGTKIRLRGQGEAGQAGGPPGDLYVAVRVSSHPYFHRRGDDLYVRVPVTLREAAEGAKVALPTPRGTVSLTIPPGSSSGTKLRIKGHGVEVRGRPAGNLFAELQIVLPKNLDATDLDLIRQLDGRHPLLPRAELKW